MSVLYTMPSEDICKRKKVNFRRKRVQKHCALVQKTYRLPDSAVSCFNECYTPFSRTSFASWRFSFRSVQIFSLRHYLRLVHDLRRSIEIFSLREWFQINKNHNQVVPSLDRVWTDYFVFAAAVCQEICRDCFCIWPSNERSAQHYKWFAVGEFGGMGP